MPDRASGRDPKPSDGLERKRAGAPGERGTSNTNGPLASLFEALVAALQSALDLVARAKLALGLLILVLALLALALLVGLIVLLLQL